VYDQKYSSKTSLEEETKILAPLPLNNSGCNGTIHAPKDKIIHNHLIGEAHPNTTHQMPHDG